MKEENKNIIIRIILIATIIVLIISNLSIIKNNFMPKNNERIPNCNVDIFDVDCEKNNSDTNEKTNTTKDTESKSTIKEKAELVVSDKNIIWSSTNNLRIFSNPVYSMEEKIAPESSNVYQFVVRNNTKNNIKYSLDFIENNQFDINMRYRLKRSNNYIVGSDNKWVDYKELDTNNVYLDSEKNHTYYLEWKWQSSNNDSKVGNRLNAGYRIDIKIKAEVANE